MALRLTSCRVVGLQYPDLVRVVERAILIMNQDFRVQARVSCGGPVAARRPVVIIAAG